ncbi:MAG: DinB family protein [Vicinamibacteria bacterium]
MQRPDPSEYHEYYHRYIDKVPEGDVIVLLSTELEQTLALLGRVPSERADYRYTSDKWSIKEVVGHVIDSERMFAYRALSFARNDPASLPSFEQEQYARFSNASRRPLRELAEELEWVRKSNLLLFKSFDEGMWTRRGIASDVSFTVRTFPYIIVGHEIHHRRVLEERYIPGVLAGTT